MQIPPARPATRHISSHNLRMNLCTNPTNPYDANQPAFEAALQSNKVHPLRLSSPPLMGFAARRIDAVR